MRKGYAVINGGSSSIKFSVFSNAAENDLEFHFGGQVDGIGVAPRFVAKAPDGSVIGREAWENRPDINHRNLLNYLITWVGDHLEDIEVQAVGHRVVHGGDIYSRPVRVEEEVLQILETFIPLAPLHQPHNLVPIQTLWELNPELIQVACFDTAFHATNPLVAKNFALPRELTAEGVHRYGFHGLSYEYIARKLPEMDPRAAVGRVVVAHLGNGASMCAMLEGRSIASTMGFTALDGLPMGTRTGCLDPGVLLYLMREKKMDADAIETLLYKKSGLLGISQISNDMRILLESDDPSAEEAIALFVYRIQREIGSLAAALGGLDALVFTAGIGEHAVQIRERVCEQAHWLGIEMDPEANQRGGPRISSTDSPISVWVIPTNEELMIATHTRDLLEETASSSPNP
jgi:acetate kinase